MVTLEWKEAAFDM